MRLRQLVIATNKIDVLADNICDLFELKKTYSDPELIIFGLKNILIPLGDTFIELVTPVKENTSAERFLKKRSSDSGYMVIVDTVDILEEKKRLEKEKLEIVWYENRKFKGIHGQSLHLHPKQVGGAILSIDNMDPPSSWLWAGREWKKNINKSLVSHLSGVNISSPQPENLLANWEKALGKKRSTEGRSINLSGSNINFVMNSQSKTEYISAFLIHTVKKSSVERRATKRDLIKEDNIHIGGVDFLLVE